MSARSGTYYGAYERHFDVTGIDVDAIKAGYENGVLKLELPESAGDQARSQEDPKSSKTQGSRAEMRLPLSWSLC